MTGGTEASASRAGAARRREDVIEDPKPRNPLLALEDWWTVWFGMAILLVATALGILHFSGAVSAQKVPKLGGWVSNPSDVFFQAGRTRLDFDEDVTLAGLADALRTKQSWATVEIVRADGGTRLRVASARPGPRETISVSALLAGGETLVLEEETPDPDGLGARAYFSQVFPTAEARLGHGHVAVTAHRVRTIVLPLLVTFLAVAFLTCVGVAVMGQSPSRYAVAFLAIFLLAVLSFGLANQSWVKGNGLSYAAWALAIGLLVSNTVGTPAWLQAGVRTEMYIKTGLVLLGAEILFGKILSLGPPGLLVAWVVTPVVIVFMWLFGTRVLKMVSKPLVMIIAAATSVCGVSAAIAVAGASRAKKEELTLGVGMTLIFTVLMMIFMPMFVHAIGMSDVLGGAWIGGTIDSTGAVVAAGAFLGPRAETVAAVVKMIQNILIGVVGFCVALYWVTSVDRDPSAPRPGLGEISYVAPSAPENLGTGRLFLPPLAQGEKESRLQILDRALEAGPLGLHLLEVCSRGAEQRRPPGA